MQAQLSTTQPAAAVTAARPPRKWCRCCNGEAQCPISTKRYINQLMSELELRFAASKPGTSLQRTATSLGPPKQRTDGLNTPLSTSCQHLEAAGAPVNCTAQRSTTAVPGQETASGGGRAPPTANLPGYWRHEERVTPGGSMPVSLEQRA